MKKTTQPEFHVRQKVQIRIGSRNSKALTDERVVEDVEEHDGEYWYKISGRTSLVPESQLVGTEAHRWQKLRKGKPVYMDYTEEGFCLKFIREGDKYFAYANGDSWQAPFDGSNPYIHDAWHLGVEITEQMYYDYGKTWGKA